VSSLPSTLTNHIPIFFTERFAAPSGKENVAANAQASLALFEAARADGDVDGARAWYQAFSKDNPTAVSYSQFRPYQYL
jgi:hypothetical protein